MNGNPTLGFDVDTRDLVKGTAALDKITAAAGGAEKAAILQAKASKEAAYSALLLAKNSGTATGAEKALAKQNYEVARQADAAARALKSQADAANIAAGGMKGYGGHVGNVFANLNDIAVMIAAGQNPVQLMMQQGTQLTQVWGQLGGNLQSIGKVVGSAFMSMLNPLNLATMAVIGLGAYAVPKLVDAFTGGADSAKKLSDNIDYLSDAFAAHNETANIAKKSISDLRDQFGLYADDVRKNARFQAQRDMFSALNAAGPVIEGIKESGLEIQKLGNQVYELQSNLDKTRLASVKTGAFLDANTILATQNNISVLTRRMNELAAGTGLTGEQILKFNGLISNIESAKLSNNADSLARAASEALAYINSIGNSQSIANGKFGDAVEILGNLRNQAAEAATLSRDVEKASVGAGDALGVAAANAGALTRNLGGAMGALSGISAKLKEQNAELGLQLQSLRTGEDLSILSAQAEADRAFHAAKATPFLMQATAEYSKANAIIAERKSLLQNIAAQEDAISNAEKDRNKSISDASKKAKDRIKESEKAALDAAKAIETKWGDAFDIVAGHMSNGFSNGLDGMLQDGLDMFAKLGIAWAKQQFLAKIGVSTDGGGAAGALSGAAGALSGAAGAASGAAGAASGAAGAASSAGGGAMAGLGKALGPIAFGISILGGIFSAAKRRREEEAARQASIADQKAQMDIGILQAQGRTQEALTAARNQELLKMDASLHPLALRKWALEDESRVATERAGIQARVLELQGKDEEAKALRRKEELKGYDDANKALKEQEWALEDQADATEKAKRKIEELTAALSEDQFSTGVDYRIAMARANAGISPNDIPMRPRPIGEERFAQAANRNEAVNNQQRQSLDNSALVNILAQIAFNTKKTADNSLLTYETQALAV